MLQLTRTEFVCTEPPDTLATLRQTFERDHAIRLPQFFDRHLVASLQQQVRCARFSDRDDEVGREGCMEDNAALGMLYLITNDQRLFTIVRAITGCAPIGSFFGRIYQMLAAAGHHDQWHSDMSNGRLIGMSVNLSEGQFAGGRFELRDKAADEPHWTITNTTAGDAVLFEISANLRHRVSAVDGHIPRIAFAGWFQSRPDFLTFLKRDERRDVEGLEVY